MASKPRLNHGTNPVTGEGRAGRDRSRRRSLVVMIPRRTFGSKTAEERRDATCSRRSESREGCGDGRQGLLAPNNSRHCQSPCIGGFGFPTKDSESRMRENPRPFDEGREEDGHGFRASHSVASRLLTFPLKPPLFLSENRGHFRDVSRKSEGVWRPSCALHTLSGGSHENVKTRRRGTFFSRIDT